MLQSLASENKILAHPASVDSIILENQEDFVSMERLAAQKAAKFKTHVASSCCIGNAGSLPSLISPENHELGKEVKPVVDRDSSN